jgi:hypothetical protein
MTKDNWLTLAMIAAVLITAAATLLGPPLAVLVQVRLSQPRPDLATRPRRFWGYLKRNWPGLLGMTISLITIRFGLRRGVVDRTTLILVAVGSSSYCLCLGLLIVFESLYRLWYSSRSPE